MGKKNNDKKTRVQIITIIVNLAVAVGAILVLVFVDDIGARFAVLTATIAASLAVLQVVMGLFFGERNELAENSHKEISRKLEQIDGAIKIDNVFKQISELDDGEQKVAYKKHIDNFVVTMMNRISGKRSGALTRLDYYAELQKAAELIKRDKESWKGKGDYPGKIWALTFWQDDEIDFTDDSESKWITTMAELDLLLSIKTERISVFQYKKELLQRQVIDDSVKVFLKKLAYYCADKDEDKDTPLEDRKLLNTTVYGINDILTLTNEEQEWIGKGFFAIMLANGDMRLIRAVSLDNKNASTLGGEIDFDSERVARLQVIWEGLKSRKIVPYLNQVCSDEIKAEMKRLKFQGIS